jgi:RimJ/RimL family protein N-acetyltransferase
MVIWDSPVAINEWVAGHGGGHAPNEYCTALGYAENGRLIGGLVFYDCNGASITVNIALTEKRFPITLLKAGLLYTFRQLQLKRLTFIIKEANIASQNLVRSLGAIPEATLRDADIDGNLLIYALFPDDCKIWSRINGKKRGYTSGS